MWVHLHRRILRPAKAQCIAERDKGLSQFLGIDAAFGGQRGQADGTIKLCHADQPRNQFVRGAAMGQLVAIGGGLRRCIGRQQFL